ncbi:NAD-dependent epimerase/dehydratase family protein [Asticcacaulis sp.]|uniref:NAD-dependent epimerase/dehydratase family protein n=1 Tax=Asticcacaulis sp. TaxID=1872648 RepID=UPI00261889D5|nr:NAD-dependent epimerase/dehydratase family protein [Asticcacaulis sp.]
MTLRSVVLGGTGFVGNGLVRALGEQGGHVRVVGRSFPRMAEAKSPPFEGVGLDLFNSSDDDLRRVIDGCDVVYHLAWSSLPSSAEADVLADMETNVIFTLRLLNLMEKTGGRLVFCSSGGTVYGHAAMDLIDETHPLQPINAYGAGKVCAETYCNLYRFTGRVDARVARLSNPYGAGQDKGRMQGALSRFVRLAVSGEQIEIWGDGEVVRDYIDIDDAARGMIALAQCNTLTEGAPAVFNIGSGRGTSLNRLLTKIEGELGRKLSVTRMPGRRIDVRSNVLNVDKARSILGWQATVELADGIRNLIATISK